MVRDVFVVRGALLGQGVDPAEERQNGADQFPLGDRFVGAVVLVERLEALGSGIGERGESLRPVNGRAPLRGAPDAVGQKVLGEQGRACGVIIPVASRTMQKLRCVNVQDFPVERVGRVRVGNPASLPLAQWLLQYRWVRSRIAFRCS